ncbi:serine hydrolase [Streptomyces sp. NPDC048270]|uniref:D-alanyl-D-alanine carboxypeptidase family protein n=1 Tax=Streptomyces sp. NPDC048270 TaxID=3154615 RepID=UPI0033D98A86
MENPVTNIPNNTADRPISLTHRAARQHQRDMRAVRMRRRVSAGVVVLLCLVAVTGFQLMRGLPAPTVTGPLSIERALPGTAPLLPWPAEGQASVMIDGYDTASSPDQRPVPTASIAKVMTAFLFLSRYPLRADEEGPSFTVSAEEAARYPTRVANGESLTPVTTGQLFTERQALQAVLAISANNVADEIARWYAGTRAAFVTEMNQTARRLGMTSTTYTDPTGFDPATVSTPADQVKLLSAALRLSEFAELAGSSYTDRSGARHLNTNPLLGEQGVFAGKTGTTTPAGRNLVFAAHRVIAGADRLVVTAVMAQPQRPEILRTAATTLLTAADRSLVSTPVIRAGETVAHLDDGTGHRQPLRAAQDITATGPPGSTVKVTIEPDGALLPNAAIGSPAAHAVTTQASPHAAPVSLVTTARLHRPSLLSQLTRTR